MRRGKIVRHVWGALLCAMVAVLATAAAASAAASFSAHGSAEQVYVTGLAPNASIALLNPDGTTLYTQRADSLGGLLFRNAPPGEGYRVRSASGGPASVP